MQPIKLSTKCLQFCLELRAFNKVISDVEGILGRRTPADVTIDGSGDGNVALSTPEHALNVGLGKRDSSEMERADGGNDTCFVVARYNC